MSEAQQPRRGIFRRIGAGISMLRTLVANVLFLLVLGVVLYLLFASDDASVGVPEQAALVLSLDAPVVESPPPFDPLTMLFSEDEPRPIALRDVLEALESAAEDDRIRALYLDVDQFPGTSPAALHSIGTAIDAFRQSGKPVITGADALGQAQYYLASHSDQLYLNPMGQVLLTGFAVQPAYFSELLEKLRVNVNVFRVGAYKSAVEPFIRNDMSDESREDTRTLVQGLWDEWRAVVAGNRGFSPALLDTLVDEQPERLGAVGGDLARLALETGLVDELLTRDAVRARLIDLVGADPDHKSFQQVNHRQYLRSVRMSNLPTGNDARIGVVVAEGTITGGREPGVVGEATAALIRSARENEDVRALVLRVNSPGGSAFFSEVLRRELELVQLAGKPVVVSMGGVAASGGYWISATADHIVTQADTITGSIGIFGLLFTFEDSADAIGVHVDGVGTHSLSGAGNPLQPLQPATRELYQRSAEHGYESFLDVVARGRDMSAADVDAVAQGRVWLGRTAVELGLADQVGNLEDAVAVAADLAGLERWRMDYLEAPKSPRQLFLEQFMAGSVGSMAAGLLEGPSTRRLQSMLEWVEEPAALLDELRDPGGVYALCFSCRVSGN